VDIYGKWLSLDEYAQTAGLGQEAARDLIRVAGLVVKTVAGREFVWVEEPQGLSSDEGPDQVRAEKPSEEGKAAEAEPPALEGDAVLTRFSGTQQLALQTERAIALVERSLNTFVMMHQEVVAEKDRFAELSREGIEERDRLLEAARARARGGGQPHRANG
jgi:uncharacterized linocin/CFP29 family protein